MTLSPPWPLTEALFGPLAAELEAAYPGWRVVGYNGTGLEAQYSLAEHIKAKYRAMTPEEREAERDRIVREFIERRDAAALAGRARGLEGSEDEQAG